MATEEGAPEGVNPDMYKEIYDNPTSFQEAWYHPDPFQRMKWREAIAKEFDKMDSLKVWKKIKRSQMPSNRRCVKYKWSLRLSGMGSSGPG